MRSKKSHWRARAEDYRDLAKHAANLEVRQVLEHLERVCVELAKTEAAPGTPPETWMDPFTQGRERTAMRWRMRQAEYQAMAESCSTGDGRQSWLVIAKRCAEAAAYLEETSSTGRRRVAKAAAAAD